MPKIGSAHCVRAPSTQPAHNEPPFPQASALHQDTRGPAGPQVPSHTAVSLPEQLSPCLWSFPWFLFCNLHSPVWFHPQ